MVLYGQSDIGNKRKVNQDNFAILSIADNAHLCVVCDGMGGNAGGSEASKMAIDSFVSYMQDFFKDCNIQNNKIILQGENIKRALGKAVKEANNTVFEASKKDTELSGMGTTLVAALFIDGQIYSVNVGDSRLYSVIPEKIEQLTHDHSYVQYLVDIGRLSPEEAKNSYNKNIITRAVGTNNEIEADITALDLPDIDGRYFLLCSDGLTNMLADEQIKEIVEKSLTEEEKVNLLIEEAKNHGGTDNITVVLAHAE